MDGVTVVWASGDGGSDGSLGVAVEASGVASAFGDALAVDKRTRNLLISD